MTKRKKHLETEKTRIAEGDARISKLKKEQAKVAKLLADNELELKKLGHKITRMQTDATDAKKKLRRWQQKMNG